MFAAQVLFEKAAKACPPARTKSVGRGSAAFV
jgi:hypothetical protein